MFLLWSLNLSAPPTAPLPLYVLSPAADNRVLAAAAENRVLAPAAENRVLAAT
jgi:hypothetical protein